MEEKDLNTRIQLVEVGKIKPYEDNAKIHTPEQVQKIADQIEAHGWDQPIVLEPDFTIIKGHGRFMAAKKLELAKVPCVMTKLTKAQAKAARIADNRLAEAPWDEDLLKIDLESLKSENFNLELTGFDASELDFYLGLDENDVMNAKKSAEESSEDDSEEAEEYEASHVRMLQLFLNDDSHPEMMKKLTDLQHSYGKSNITDAAIEAIREIHSIKFPKK